MAQVLAKLFVHVQEDALAGGHPIFDIATGWQYGGSLLQLGVGKIGNECSSRLGGHFQSVRLIHCGAELGIPIAGNFDSEVYG